MTCVKLKPLYHIFLGDRMRFQGLQQLTARLIGAFFLGAAVLLCPVASNAAEGPTLPPAEYKPLPEGTKVKYDNWGYTVTESDGFNIALQTNLRKIIHTYGVFVREGEQVYTTNYSGGANSEYFQTELNANNESSVEKLWPLKIGKKTELMLDEALEHHYFGEIVRSWHVTLEVVETAPLEIDGHRYQTYVVREHGTGSELPLQLWGTDGAAREYEKIHWYDPNSGLVLKTTQEWISGPDKGDIEETSLADVTFPKGTTSHALKEIKAGGKGNGKLLAEATRLNQEAETAHLKREAERLKQQAELERFKQQAELERLKQQAELDRLKQQAELVRAKREIEIARLQRGAGTSQPLETRQNGAKEEERLWVSIKQTRKTAALEDYLKRYPEGRFRGDAEARLKVLEKFRIVEGVDFGKYHALIIGINEYKHLPKLNTAVNDAKGVAKVLTDDYGFKVKLLLNPSRDDILDAFDEYQEALGFDDNLLIYYAGHGWLNEESNRGYWLPVDAKPNRRSRWMSNATLTDTLKTMQAKHVMVVADSCYSGTLTRSANVGLRSGDYWKRMSKKWARVALVSGGLEPVADSGGGNHSPFAKAFIDALTSNEAVMDGTQMFGKVRRPVMVSAQQTPEFSDVRNAGHDGGDFLFVRKR